MTVIRELTTSPLRFQKVDQVYIDQFFVLVGTALLNVHGICGGSWDQKWLCLLTDGLLISLAFLRTTTHIVYIPKLTPSAHLFLSLAIFGCLVSLVANWHGIQIVRWGERFSFFCVGFLCYQRAMRDATKMRNTLRVSAIAIFFCLTLGWAINAFRAGHLALETSSYPCFENRNMFTEALALTVLIFLATSRSSFLDNPFRFVGGLVFLGIFSLFLYIISSRSAFLISSGTVLLGLFWNFRKSSTRPYLELTLLLLFLFPVLAVPVFNPSGLTRLALIKQSYQMIKDHILGVGIGQFEISRLAYPMAYLEPDAVGRLFRSPHNEFLRLAVEENLLTALGTYALLAQQLKTHLQKIISTQEKWALSALALFLFIETMVQFPFENPYPSLGLASLFGFFLRRTQAVPVQINWRHRFIVLAMAAIINVALFIRVATLPACASG